MQVEIDYVLVLVSVIIIDLVLKKCFIHFHFPTSTTHKVDKAYEPFQLVIVAHSIAENSYIFQLDSFITLEVIAFFPTYLCWSSLFFFIIITIFINARVEKATSTHTLP